MKVTLTRTRSLRSSCVVHRPVIDTICWSQSQVSFLSALFSPQPWRCWKAKAKRIKVSVHLYVMLMCQFFFPPPYHNRLVFSAVILWRTRHLWRLWVSAAVMRLGCINSADSREYEKSWHFDFRNHRAIRWYDKSISPYLARKHKLPWPASKLPGRVWLTVNV